MSDDVANKGRNIWRSFVGVIAYTKELKTTNQSGSPKGTSDKPNVFRKQPKKSRQSGSPKGTKYNKRVRFFVSNQRKKAEAFSERNQRQQDSHFFQNEPNTARQSGFPNGTNDNKTETFSESNQR